MALGAVYIRPQPLALPVTDDVTPVDVILAFFEAILKDPQAALPALTITGEEAANAFRDFAANMEERLRLADGKLRNVFQPFSDPLMTFVNGLERDILATVPAFLQAFSKLLDQLTADKVVEMVSKLADIFEHDLGISPATLRTLFTDLMARAIERLQSRVTGGDTSDEAVALYDFGTGLDDIRLLLSDELQLPDVNLQFVLDLIRATFQELGIDRVALLVREILSRGEQVLDPLTKIATAIAEINVTVTVSPSARFMASNGSPGEPTTGLPDDDTAWYASWVAGKEVRFNEIDLGTHPGTGDAPNPSLTRFSNPWLSGFTYATFKPETMESVAFHTAWIFPLVETLFFHALSVEQGDVVNNINAIILNIVEIGLIIGGGPSDRDPNQTRYKKRPLPYWVKGYLWPFVSFWGRALETIPHFFDDFYTWAFAFADLGEDLYFRRWTWLGRELWLSIMTLANHDAAKLDEIRSQTTDPAAKALVEKYRNANYFDGVCMAAGELGTVLYCLICAKTRNAQYGLSPGLVVPHIGFLVLNLLLVYPAFEVSAFLLVRLATKERAFQPGDPGHLTRTLLRERMFRPYSFSSVTDGIATVLSALVGAVTAGLDYFIYLHLFSDDATSGGTLTLDSTGQSAPQPLQGYPGQSQSPYLLPFGGSQETCIQGNMGIFSHHPQGGRGQTYAFDFALDQGAEVLCSRSGIIVDIDDTIPTGQAGSGQPWNHVLVLHMIVVKPGEQPPPGVVLQDAVPVPPGGPGVFADNLERLPPGIQFPPYPVLPGGITVPLHPSAAIQPDGWVPVQPYYAGFPGFPVGTQFAFLIPGQDQGMGSGAGTVPSGGLLSNGTVAIAATSMSYGHGLGNFMTQTVPAPGGNKPLYRSGVNAAAAAATAAALAGGATPAAAATAGAAAGNTAQEQVLGQFVKQGQVIMLADNTGVSLMNHVHVHVNGQVLQSPSPLGSGAGAAWSIPFVYQDLKNDIAHGIFKGIFYENGVARIFTTYRSKNTRVPPE